MLVSLWVIPLVAIVAKYTQTVETDLGQVYLFPH